MKRGVDYIGVGIGVVIVNPEGKIFLSRRGDGAQNERGKWECPGGALEFGESFEDTVVREIKEEFGFTIEPVEQLKPFNHLLPDEHQHWVALCFVCRVVEGKPQILEPDKCSAIGWYSLTEAERMDLTLPAQHRIKQLKEKSPVGLPNQY